MSGSIIGNALLWLIAVAGSGTAWIVSGSLWAAVAVALLVLLPFVSWLGNLWLRRGMQVRLEMPLTGEKNQEIPVALRLTPKRFLLPGHTWALVTAHNDLTGETDRIRISEGREVTLRARHCGRLCVTVERLWLMDLFGFLPMPCTVNAQMHITILPEMFPVEVTALQKMAAAQESEYYRSDCRGNDVTELFQLREYVPGDNLRGIHWKLSSKLGQLIFREPAMPEDHALLLCWDQSEGIPSVQDALAEAVFSVGQALCEAGSPFTLGWMEKGELCTAEIDGQDALIRHFPALLKGKGYGQPLTAPSDFGYMLLFTGTPVPAAPGISVFYCGERSVPGAAAFTPKTCRETLQRLDVGYEN